MNATTTVIHGGFTSGPTTKNWTHTTTGSNRLLVLFADIWQDVGGTGTITSATYNGVSLTKATSTRAGGMASEIWYLVNPAPGSNTVSVTVTGATDAIKLAAADFTGVTQSSPLDASSSPLLPAKNIGTYIPGGIPANSWAVATIPLTDMQAATTTVKGFVIESESATTVYYDALQFTSTASSSATTTTTYAYDHAGTRVKLTEGSTTTFFPNTLYEQSGTTGTTTKHIFDTHGTLLATVQKATASSTPVVRYVHTDHLTGSNVVTDATGNVAETMDYYPYGAMRIDDKVGGYGGERRKFAGTEYDSGTGLNYMGARYYNATPGRFLSEDPVFLAVGSPDLKQKTGLELQKYLENPQTHNSYSYTANNPLKYMDKEGEWIDTVVDIVALAYSGYRLGHAVVNGGDIKNGAINFGLDGISTALPGVAGLGALRRAANVAEGAKDAGKTISGAIKLGEKYQHVLDRHTVGGSKYIPGKTSYFQECRYARDAFRPS